VSRMNSKKEVQCCTRDEGRPLEAGLQRLASNHLKRLWIKSTVVSVKEQGTAMTVSGMGKLVNKPEPLLKCRNRNLVMSKPGA